MKSGFSTTQMRGKERDTPKGEPIPTGFPGVGEGGE